METKIKLPETITEFLDQQITHCQTFNADHPQIERARNLISKCLYCKSLNEKSLEYREIVNDIIDGILKHNYKNFPLDAHPSDNSFANECIKDIHVWLKTVEKLKIA